MSDRIIALIALGILSGVFYHYGQTAEAAIVAALAVIYLWKGRP